MRKSYTLTGLVMVAILVLLIILIRPWSAEFSLSSVKSRSVDFFSSVPYAAVRLGVRSALKTGDFEEALQLLKAQENLAKLLGNTNFMKQDLIDHSIYIFKRAQLFGETGLFSEWITYLLQQNPDHVGLMLAASVPDLKLEERDKILGELIHGLPIDPIIYRSMLQQELENQPVDNENIARICNQYDQAVESQYDSWFFPEKFPNGQGFRAPILSILNSDLSSEFFYDRNTWTPDAKFVAYRFNEAKNLTSFRLVLPWPEGIVFSFQSIEIQTPFETLSFSPESVSILPLRGFIVNKNSYATFSNIGESLLIRLPSPKTILATEIIIRFSFKKLPLFNFCKTG